MGLFDDILKKQTPTTDQGNPVGSSPMGSGGSDPQGGSQGAGSGNPAPVIVKGESSTLFGPNSEAETIRAQATPPSTPLVHAEEDSSSVLMGSSQISVPIAPVAPPQEPMVVAEEPVFQAAPAPTTNDTLSAIVSSAQMSAPSQNDAIVLNPAPAATPVVAQDDLLQIPAGPSLFDHIMHDDDTPAPAATVTPEITAAETTPAPVNFQFQTETNSAPATPSVAVASETVEQSAPAQVPPVASMSPSSPASSYSTPREFIERSLDNIDTMLATIDGRHTSKMTEAEGYRMEKMRFAELEKNAYAEAEIMDRERDHTLRMKSIFERELETDEVNRTKKAQASQENAPEKHIHAHKRHVHEEEEEAIAAS